MKIACEVIKDLLVLYGDEACSKESKELVEEHLGECEACASYLKKMQETDEMITPEIRKEFLKEERVMKKSYRKIRNRWAVSIVAVFMLFPLLGVGILGYHEYVGEGIAFSNLDDIYRCTRYLHYIESREYEKAAEMVDFAQMDYQLIDSVKDMPEAQFQEYMEKRFVQKLEEYERLGIHIDNIRYRNAYNVMGANDWTIELRIDENYPDGSKQSVRVDLDGESMIMGASSHSMGSIRYRFIEEALHLYSEDDPLGYGEFEVLFEVNEGERATVKWNADLIEQYHLVNIGIVHTSYKTAASISDDLLPGGVAEVAVPGDYAVFGVTAQHETVVFGENSGIEVVVEPID